MLNTFALLIWSAPKLMKSYHEQALALKDALIQRRRDFHRYPELAFEETRTSRIVAAELQSLDMEVITGIGQTGVVGILEGTQDGPTVLVRCDMDALPIEEENDAPYRSQEAHKMHACGHDGHMSIALAVAKMLHAGREHIKGRIKFVFQPAEEVGRGAAAMIQDGVLGNPKPDVSLGLHLWSELPTGQVVINDSPFMAGATIFTIQLTGAGGHAGQPHTTIDPVAAAAQMVLSLQTIVSRNVNPTDTAVLSVTQVQAGDAFNVIPSHATIKGTIRTFLPETQAMIEERMAAIVHGIAEATQCKATVDIQNLVPPVINSSEHAHRLREQFSVIAPQYTYQNDLKLMVSEDMAYFLDHSGGVFFLVGSGSNGKNYPHHHPKFDLDEDALVVGASILAAAVSEYVF